MGPEHELNLTGAVHHRVDGHRRAAVVQLKPRVVRRFGPLVAGPRLLVAVGGRVAAVRAVTVVLGPTAIFNLLFLASL